MNLIVDAAIADPQRVAADPTLSAFVTANAGSGKTKTLIDRVARLLLAGAEPAAILCVTYTKAAAAEMQRRLFERLGRWSVCDDAELSRQLAELEGPAANDDYEPARLSAARALFARALETPGGLKIQTIHAFCEKLLRRFPLEAGVSPGFRVMDDVAAAAIAASARRGVAHYALEGTGAVAEAYARFSVALDFNAFNSMFQAFEARRGALAAFLDVQGGLHGAQSWIWEACGFDGPADAEAEAAEAMAALDGELCLAAAAVLDAGGKTDQRCAAQLRALAQLEAPTLADALAVLFTEKGEGTPAAWVAKTSGLKAHEGLRGRLLDAQRALEIGREKVRAARVAWDSVYALTLADAYLTAYRLEKQSAGALDFADLIERTGKLLATRPAAAWVLYKLDGGIDHVLVDEAQDTAPEQWDIVRALTGEFFSGEGRPRDTQIERSLFIVGDDKQSIYSFQGADPERLILETQDYMLRIEAARRRGVVAPLTASWRSTVEVLRFVDAVFIAGAPPRLEPLRHEPMRADHRGCVDVWPLVQEIRGEDRGAWDAPLDEEAETGANRRLAEAIACEIGDLVARGDAVFDKDSQAWRPARFGDVLILVRKRGALFEDILRALKHARVPVGGADRLALSQHIVFDDLMALARFVQFPRDELNLAALLKSPLCGLDDDSLYALAHRREEQNLWDLLHARAAERPHWQGAAALLAQARALAGERRPFEFFSRMLSLRDAQGRSTRSRLLRRLGGEAEDALDEFLNQVLAAEARGVDDLESLVAAFADLDIVVKREMGDGRDEVRVMTTHGAKGLEAPIVFLPEAAAQAGARGSPLMETDKGGFLWSASKAADCEASAAARERRARKEDEEALRLLYVALTRARDRLVICGRIAANRREEGLKGWWPLLKAALDHEQVAPHVRPAACGAVTALRFGPDPRALGASQRSDSGPSALASWAGEDAEAEGFARFAQPSETASDAGRAPSPLIETAGLGRFRRGDLIHRLLQILPDLPAADRAAAAATLLGRETDLNDVQRAEMATAALSVLRDPRFAEVFGPGSRAEVAITGGASSLPAGLAISGRIDRLVVLPDRVLVVDFKTNRPSPATIEAADPAYIRQMAMYAAVLGEVFPGRVVEAALVWTDGPKLMPVQENLMAQSLVELGRSG
ncbi:MAG: double-strand break repair helicase AddA [Phenylobacterium sp.]|nr:double-strand break repair helicase AddA [Phenylobacterium sp.]MDP3660227.1 double-strand break repair helicase AddA [Phenylobacterium sp.]